MATAFQAALGLRDLTVTAREADDGVVLDGTIPWASNLFPDGAVVVLPARTEAGRARRRRHHDRPGRASGCRPYPELLALGATASTVRDASRASRCRRSVC